MALSGAEIVTLLVLVTSSFVATNIDNLLILVVLLGANQQRRSAVLVGFITSAITVMVFAVLGVVVGSILDAGLVGYLGLVPLSLGCYMLYSQWRGGREELAEDLAPVGSGEPGIWLTTFILMFSNSGDSLAIFLPLLAESERESLLLIIVTYLVTALLWASLAYLISGQRELAARIERRAGLIVPWVMIGVGVYILMDTATDTLV